MQGSSTFPLAIGIITALVILMLSGCSAKDRLMYFGGHRGFTTERQLLGVSLGDSLSAALGKLQKEGLPECGETEIRKLPAQLSNLAGPIRLYSCGDGSTLHRTRLVVSVYVDAHDKVVALQWYSRP